MSQPPPDADPNAFTQPLPAVDAHAVPPVDAQPMPPAPPAPKQRGPLQPRGPYVHRFWSLPIDLLGRLVAFLIDLAGVPFVLTAFAFASIDRGMSAYAARSATGFETLALATIAIALVFAYVCEALTGATLGKLVFGLHVRRVDGGHAGGGRVFVRYLFLPVDLVAIGPLLALVTKRRQRLGDLVAGTVVSRSPLGLFAPLVGLVLVLAIGYAEITYGGGLTSAIEVAAETSIVAPPALGRIASGLGIGAASLGALHPGSPATSPATSLATQAPDASITPDTSGTSDASSTPDGSSTPNPIDTPGAPSSAP